MNKHLSSLTAALLAITVSGLSISSASADDQKKPFKLKIQEDTTRVPTLNRNDIHKNPDQDDFDPDSGMQEIDAPKRAFQMEKPVAPPKQPKKPFKLQADDGGAMQQATPMAAPTDLGGEQDPLPTQVQQPPPQPTYDPNDPDSSPDMQLAWDQWHKRVANTIYDRFNFFAKAAFKHSPPLLASLSYTVTRDGHISNLNVAQKSTNVLFNVLCYQAVKSLDGDLSVLQFPMGSRRMFVPKSGTFTQNYGNQGFKYTVGDQETVRGQQRR